MRSFFGSLPPLPRATARQRSCRALCWSAAGLLLLAGCGGSGRHSTAADSGAAPRSRPGKLIVFHAASLTRPFETLEKQLETERPGLDIIRDSSSSRLAIRKITDLGRRADIIASADEALLRQMMLPDYVSWVALFARNRIVIAYTDKSRYRNEINADNWYDILLRDDVNFGYADPGMAPVGYRTLLCWKLADIYYRDRLRGKSIYEQLRKACPQRFIRPHCNELIPLLESLTLDYTFQYRSVALQHHLEWLKLPDAIDLGNEKLSDVYARVSTEVPGKTRNRVEKRVGRPIIYGIAIPENARNPALAEWFLERLFSKTGQSAMKESFQEPISPVLCKNRDQAPAALRPFLKEAEHLNP